MKTIKYYKMDKASSNSQIEDVDVYFYGVDGSNNKIVGVAATDHTQFETEANVTGITFSDAESYIENSHLCGELNRLISKRIREKYSIDDEIAMLKKAETDLKRKVYESFVAAIKTDVNAKKKEYGIIGA